ncbi:MAG: hypothetical protein UZ07_CHB004003010 [Chlorobi bacterium OLB7]|nr:MAG: hypothetical protein UZ07_CHB004003010 [Chlorobi bacterium OLB7]
MIEDDVIEDDVIEDDVIEDDVMEMIEQHNSGSQQRDVEIKFNSTENINTHVHVTRNH